MHKMHIQRRVFDACLCHENEQHGIFKMESPLEEIPNLQTIIFTVCVCFRSGGVYILLDMQMMSFIAVSSGAKHWSLLSWVLYLGRVWMRNLRTAPHMQFMQFDVTNCDIYCNTYILTSLFYMVSCDSSWCCCWKIYEGTPIFNQLDLDTPEGGLYIWPFKKGSNRQLKV